MPERLTATAVRILLLCGVMLCLGPPAASAHKLKIFASAEGEDITGYVYFPGGGRARGLTVSVLGPEGEELGQAVTDGDGVFRFTPTAGCAHEFVADSGDGHRAVFVVGEEELPPALRVATAGEHAAMTAAAEPGEATEGATRTPQAELDAALQARVEDAVARQVRPLREQIEQYEEKVRFRDVVGGIGYILGLAGVVFYFLGRRRKP